MLHDDVELAIRAAALDDEIGQLLAELDAIILDEAVLALAGRLEQSAELRAHHVTAEKDLPERRLQLREAELAISGLLGRLDRADEADPGSLLLGAATIGTLRGLIERRSGVEAARDAARNELAEAGHRLDEARAGLGELRRPARDGHGQATQIATLTAALTAWRASDYAARRRVAERTAETHRTALAERLEALRPWTGDAGQLAVPAATDIAHWKEASAKARQQIERLEEDASRFGNECARYRAELDAVTRIARVVGSEEAAARRALREKAWADHRRQLSAASADTFEAALSRDDDITVGRLRHEKERARGSSNSPRHSPGQRWG